VVPAGAKAHICNKILRCEKIAHFYIEQKFHKFPNYLQKGLKIFPKNSEGVKLFDLQKVPDFAKA